jgi:hypothetical protein
MRNFVLLLMSVLLIQTATAQSPNIKFQVYFETDHYKLDKKAIEVLKEAIHQIDLDKIIEVYISGHTDSVGTSDYNLELSEKRVTSVVDYLINNQIPEDKIRSAKGYGENKPIVANTTDDNMYKNRRVEIILVYQLEGKLIEKQEDEIDLFKIDEDTFRLIGNEGTIIEFPPGAFYPYKIKDFDISVDELFTIDEMAARNMTTMSNLGEELASSGVICLNAIAKYDTIRNPRNAWEKFKVKVPVQAGLCNTRNLVIWYPEKDGNKTVWKSTKVTIRTEVINGQAYYVYKTNKVTCMNLDCKISNGKYQRPRLAVRGHLIENLELHYDSLNSLLYYKKSARKRMRFTLLPERNPKINVLVQQKNDKYDYYFANLNLERDFKYKQHRNLFIMRKRDAKRNIQNHTYLAKY